MTVPRSNISALRPPLLCFAQTLSVEPDQHFLQTKSTLVTERSAMLDAVRLIGELHAYQPWVNLGLNESEFMTKLGITRDCYYSRVRAARALRGFPEMNTVFLSGEVALSTIGMIESKLTRDNIAVVLENVRGKS